MAAGQKLTRWQLQFAVLLSGQAFSLLGSGLVQFAIIWWLTRETDSTIVLSVSTIVGLLPVILLLPVAGVVVDRVNRRLVMMAADAFIAVVTLLMAVLFTAGVLEVWMIYLLLFLRSAGSAFHMPAFESAVPLIAPEHHLVRTAAMTQMLRSGVNLAAPMLGALLIEFTTLPNILLIDVVTAGMAILSLAPIAIPDLPSAEGPGITLSGYIRDFTLGLRYVYYWKGLLALIVVFSLSNFLLAPLLSMMPLIITRHFQGGAREYGFFEMALAAGIIAGSLTLSISGGFRRKMVSINLSQIICGIAIASIVLVPARSFYLVLVLAAICGIMSAFVNSPVTAILQAKVDKDMQGRVLSIVSVFCMLSMPLSLAVAGPLANLVGLMRIVYIPGLISILVGILCFFIPSLMHLEDRRPAVPANNAAAGDSGLTPAGPEER